MVTRMNRRYVAAFTCALVLIQQLPAYSTSGDEREARDHQYHSLQAFAEALRGTIDPDELEQSAMLDRLDYDAANIVDFVKSNIGFEQYLGALRSAQGTFLSKAGNSLDQSILLASMLRDAGYEARIHRGRLSTEQASQLVSQIGIPGQLVDRQLDTARIEEVVEEYALEFGATMKTTGNATAQVENLKEDDVYQPRAETESKWLMDLLADNGIVLGDPAGQAQLIEEAKDYFWIDYKTEDSGVWVAVHPSFPGDGPFDAIDPLETYTESIPTDLQQRLRMQFFIERKTSGKITEHKLTDAWERPAANLARTPVTFYFVSAALNSSLNKPDGKLKPLEVPSEDTDIFMPILNGQPLKNAFDLNGNIVPLAEAGSMFGAFFATVSDKLNLGAGALSSLGSKSDRKQERAMSLHAVKVVYTVIMPDGSETEHVRLLYKSRSEPGLSAVEEKVEKYRRLTQKYSLMANTGSLPDAYVVDQYLATVSRAHDTAEGAIEVLQSDRPQPGKTLDVSWDGHIPLFGLFERGRRDFVSYRSEANVVVHHETLPFGGVIREGIDIVHSQSRSFRWNDHAPNLDASANLEQGVWETVIESAPFDTADSNAALDTWSAFDDARSSTTKIAVLTQEDATNVDEMPLSDSARSNIRRDLETGRVVVFPLSFDDQNPQQFAWWSIDPVTGSTLGKNELGEGATATEYKVLLILIGASIAAIFATEACIDSGGEAFGCALCGLLAGATTAIAIYLVLPGATAASATAAGEAAGAQALAVALDAGLSLEVATGASLSAAQINAAAAALRLQKIAGYFKAFVLAFGPAAAYVCGGGVLKK